MNYDSNFIATSDRAVFQRNSKTTGTEVLPGTITLSCLSPEQLCRLTSSEGGEIFSTEILIDTTQRELIFTLPKGSLKSVGNTFSPVDFIAKKLVWNDFNSKLTLSGDVEISQQGFGNLQATKEVRLVLTTIEGKKVLRGLETTGDAVLRYVDPDTQLDHVLRCYGSLRIDHQKKETKLQSPENGDGSVVEGYQVFFKDAKGEIYADKAFVKYDYVNQKIAPARIVLQGNVKITNTLEQSEENKPPAYQYILADRVDFIPQTKEMIFKAAKERRVLFFDKGNHLEVSAPGLKLIRDKATCKETVQGLGDVRFSFVESEFDQLRHHFSFEKMIPGQDNPAEK